MLRESLLQVWPDAIHLTAKEELTAIRDPAKALLLTDSERISERAARLGICCIHLGSGNDRYARMTIEEIRDLKSALPEMCFCHYHLLPFTVAEFCFPAPTGAFRRIVIRESVEEDFDELKNMFTEEDIDKLKGCLDAESMDLLLPEGENLPVEKKPAEKKSAENLPVEKRPAENLPAKKQPVPCEKDEELYERFQQYIRHSYDFWLCGFWTVMVDEKIAGWCGLYPGKGEEMCLGYFIRREFRRQGLAEAVCRKILDFAAGELGLEEVGLEVSDANTASLRLAKKLGFALQPEDPKPGKEGRKNAAHSLSEFKNAAHVLSESKNAAHILYFRKEL